MLMKFKLFLPVILFVQLSQLGTYSPLLYCLSCKGSRGLHVITPSVEDLQQAHLYVLNNSNEVLPYILHHEGLMKESNPKMSKNRDLKEHNKTFLYWFKDTIFVDYNASKTLIKLANGPKRDVITWKRYDINKYSFYTKA